MSLLGTKLSSSGTIGGTDTLSDNFVSRLEGIQEIINTNVIFNNSKMTILNSPTGCDENSNIFTIDNNNLFTINPKQLKDVALSAGLTYLDGFNVFSSDLNTNFLIRDNAGVLRTSNKKLNEMAYKSTNQDFTGTKTFNNLKISSETSNTNYKVALFNTDNTTLLKSNYSIQQIADRLTTDLYCWLNFTEGNYKNLGIVDLHKPINDEKRELVKGRDHYPLEIYTNSADHLVYEPITLDKNQITLCFWTEGTSFLIGLKDYNGSWDKGFYLHGNDFKIRQTTAISISDLSFQTGRIYFIVLQYDKDTKMTYFYRKSSADNDYKENTATGTNVNTPNWSLFLAHVGTTSKLYDVKVYNTLLTSDQINKLYQQGYLTPFTVSARTATVNPFSISTQPFSYFDQQLVCYGYFYLPDKWVSGNWFANFDSSRLWTDEIRAKRIARQRWDAPYGHKYTAISLETKSSARSWFAIEILPTEEGDEVYPDDIVLCLDIDGTDHKMPVPWNKHPTYPENDFHHGAKNTPITYWYGFRRTDDQYRYLTFHLDPVETTTNYKIRFFLRIWFYWGYY